MNIYTVVKTPDGRTGIYIGGLFGGPSGGYDEVVFDDQSHERFPHDQLKKARIKLGYRWDLPGQFTTGHPHWQWVLKRYFAINRVIDCLSHLRLAIERQMEPRCWNDIEGLWGAVMDAWTSHWGSMYPRWAMRHAWFLLFGDHLPPNIDALAQIYSADVHLRRDLFFRHRREQEALAGGPPLQAILPGFSP